MDDNTAQGGQDKGQEKKKPIQNSSKAPPPLPSDAKKDEPSAPGPAANNKKPASGASSQPKTTEDPTASKDLDSAKKLAEDMAPAKKPSSVGKPSPTPPGSTSSAQGDKPTPPTDKSTGAQPTQPGGSPKSTSSAPSPPGKSTKPTDKPQTPSPGSPGSPTQPGQGKQDKANSAPPGGSFGNIKSGSTMISQPSRQASASKPPQSSPTKPATPGGQQGGSPPPSPGQAVDSQVTTSAPGGGGDSKFKIFVIIGVIILLLIWGAAGYLFIQNRNLQDEVEGTADTAQTQEAETPTPTPEFTPDQVQIKNGNVVRIRPTGEESVLINKEDYQSTGITGFSSVTVSPDNNLICFESVPPAPEPALYYANVDGTSVTEVSPNRQNCNWHPESNMLAYNNYPAETGAVNIFLYDITTGEETNLTSEVTADAARQYAVDGFSQDGTTLTCSFVELDSAGEPASQGDCEIDVQTGAYTELAS